jgi:hypothetical protein
VEKIAALRGDPTTKVAKVSSNSDPAKVTDGWLRRARREP